MIDTTDATFARDVLDAAVPVVVEFTAPWCRPCRAIEPWLEALEERHEGRLLVARLDNLGKGAAGAAVQNIRLMLGL